MSHLGPDNATLTIRTGRSGGAAKAGHDLLIEVGSWQATLDLEGQPALTLSADSSSLRVLEGTGGSWPVPCAYNARSAIVRAWDGSVVATNAPLSHWSASGEVSSAAAASSCALARILPVALWIAAGVCADGVVL